MEGVRQYVISVTAAAMICGIVSGMVKNSPANGIVRMLCGLFLVFTVIYPIARLDIDELPFEMLPYTQMGADTAAAGENTAQTEMADIIKAEVEAYILDKAEMLGLDLAVTVTLKGDTVPIPVKAELSGNVSPYNRQRLETIIYKDLGITKENQLWTG